MATNVKYPSSYFFTESAFNQNTGLNNKAFGPINENEFQITTKFPGALKAFSVTSGTLFYAQFGSYDDKINAILRPDGDVGLGLKIKYFIYRGLNFNEIYYKDNGQVKTKPKNSPNILQFLDKVWDEYIEFNGTDQGFNGEKSGYEVGATPKKLIKKFFSQTDGASLLHVNEGTHIGTFVDGFGGFEIVLDEGDFNQDKSDTALELDENFITATECILKIDGNISLPPGSLDKIFGGNTTTGNERVFRENIYRFIDPAAFYGSHVTVNDSTNTGKIHIKEFTSSPITTPTKIFENIVDKFLNKTKTYIYIKGVNGRSYNFYEQSTHPIKVGAIPTTSIPESFEYKKWPIKCIENAFNYSFSLENIKTNNCIVYCNVGLSINNNLGFLTSEQLLIERINPGQKQPIKFIIPSKNIPFSSIIYLSYSDRESLNSIFGNINLKTIFEKEDFGTTSNNIAYVNHLRPVLIKEGYEVGLNNTKLVLEGNYISISQETSAPLPSDAELAKNLRTYIVSPLKTTKKKHSKAEECSINAGYLTASDGTDNDASYTRGIYGQGEIWKGKIVDNIIASATISLNSLSYRRKDNDEDLPIYQLGISQLDYKNLTAGIPTDASNLFFVFEDEQSPANGSFLRYSVKIEYDNKNGDKQPPNNASVLIYTIDGYFFFSEDYSKEFKTERCKEFSTIAVDFLPYSLTSYQYGYEECGFDFAGFEGREHYKDIVGMYYDSSGTPKNLTKGETINFKSERLRYLRLLSRNYDNKPTNWRTIFPFHTNSYITLFEGDVTTIQCKVTKNTDPKKLFYRYNSKYISIDNSPANPSATDTFVNKEISSFVNHTITVKALQKFDRDQVLEVIDDKNRTAGKLVVLSNKYIGKINILLVNCKTELTGNPNAIPKEGLPPANHTIVENVLRHFFKQIYITPTFQYEDLDLTSPTVINTFKNNYVFSGTAIIKSTTAMSNYCVSLLQSANKSSSMILLLFNESGALEDTTGIGPGTVLRGEAFNLGGATGARIFEGGIINNVIAHEALHSLGLYHSFDIDGGYTFKQSVGDFDASNDTDNVMDYFFDFDDKKRKLIWKWQMKKIYNTDNCGRLILK